jgi:prepilin-type N-terminal cleavage/methylation domain-containing protein
MGVTSIENEFEGIPNKSQGGFTLLEVMVVVAIIGIGAAIAVPEFVQWNARTQLRQATSEIASQLTMARMAAMNRNRGVDVSIQATSGVVNVSAVVSGGLVTVIPTRSFANNVRAVTGGPVTVSFSSLGVKTSAGTGTQTFGVCDANNVQYSVTIIPTGRVNWSANSTTTPCP